MQVYDGLPILTAQPRVATRLVAIWPLGRETSVADYQRLAHMAIDDALAADRIPVVVGGSGLYLRAALADLTMAPPPAAGVRERWERVYDRLGPARAYALLTERDPAAAGRTHPNDRRRVVRSLELSDAETTRAGDDLWSETYRHPTLLVGLDVPRDELDRRIAARARAMFDQGVVDEVRAALAGQLSTTAGQVIGLREIAELSPDEALEAIVLRTRQLAAYQRKWMRRLPGLATVAADRPPGDVADEILDMACSREHLSLDGGEGRA
jgi:tRNA dimethylallyltransferase